MIPRTQAVPESGAAASSSAGSSASSKSPPPSSSSSSKPSTARTSPPSHSATTFSSSSSGRPRDGDATSEKRAMSPSASRVPQGQHSQSTPRSRSPSPNAVASGSASSSSKRLHSPTASSSISPSPSKIARTNSPSRAGNDTRATPPRASPTRASPSPSSPTAQRRQQSPSSRPAATSPNPQSPTSSRKGKSKATAADAVILSNPSPPRAIGGAPLAPTSPSDRLAEQSHSSAGPASISDLPGATPHDIVQDLSADSSGSSSANTSLETDLPANLVDGVSQVRVPDPLMLTSTIPRGSYHQCGTARRVKVYELLNETWQDRGTGYCAGVYDEGQDEALLVARTENESLKIEGALPDPRRPKLDPQQSGEGGEEAGGEGEGGTHPYWLVVSENLDQEKILLKTRVVKEDVYQKQQDTLVVWTEPDGTDMALSFQEADGCHEVWEFIVEVQKHFQQNSGVGQDSLSDPPTPDPGSPQSNDNDFSMSALGVGSEGMIDASTFTLPDPSLANIEEVDMFLKASAQRGPTAREKMAEWIVRGDFIRKLCPVFHDAEDLENLEALHCLCSIMQTIVMLNDSMIIEVILTDEVFLSVIGMFEYDPDFPTLKASYRDYLRNTAHFKQVVEFEDPKVITKIHQVYRLQYLKDVILARILDDAMFSVLNSWIFFHQVDIVQFCTTSETLLPKLFAICAPDSTETREKKHDAVFFLQNLCAMGKQIQLPARIALYRTLAETGLLSVLEFAMVEKDKKVQDAAAEMLMVIIEYDPNSVRNHVLVQVDEKRKTLVAIMSTLLHEEEDLGLKSQICESLRTLFDTGSESGPPNVSLAAAAAAARSKGDPERFLTWLYEADVEHLFSPLKTLPKVSTLGRDTRLDLSPRPRSALLGHLCDLLCYSVAQHTFRSQYFVITSVVAAHVGSLLYAKEKHMRLAAVRFFRACIGSNNQFTNRHFIKQDIFAALLTLTEKESKRDNLVLSACLDLFEHLVREHMRPLLGHLIKEYSARLCELAEGEYTRKTFTALLTAAVDVETYGGGRSGSSVDESNETAGASSSQILAGGQAAADDAGAASPPSDGSTTKRQDRDRAARGFGAPGAGLDMDEESYFNGGGDSDEEEDKAARSGRTTSRGIVAYDDSDGEDEVDADAKQAAAGSSSQVSTTISGPSRSSSSAEQQQQQQQQQQQVPTMEELLLGTHPTATPPVREAKRSATDEEPALDDADDFERRVKSKRRLDSEGEGEGEDDALAAAAGEGGFIRAAPTKTYGRGGGGVGAGAGAGAGGGAKKISLGLSSSSKQMAAAAGSGAEGSSEAAKSKSEEK